MNTSALHHSKVVTATKDETIVEAARRMREQHVGDLVIVGESNHRRVPVGILTDRDIVVSVVARDPEHLSTLLVGDVMTGGIISAAEGDELEDVIKVMRQHKLRRIPVVGAEGELRGIISYDDVMEYLAAQLSSLTQIAKQQPRAEQQTRP